MWAAWTNQSLAAVPVAIEKTRQETQHIVPAPVSDRRLIILGKSVLCRTGFFSRALALDGFLP